jgi:hypothetical protein
VRSHNASPAKPHYAALRKILNAHAGRLAAAIDCPAAETAPRPHRERHGAGGTRMAG